MNLLQPLQIIPVVVNLMGAVNSFALQDHKVLSQSTHVVVHLGSWLKMEERVIVSLSLSSLYDSFHFSAFLNFLMEVNISVSSLQSSMKFGWAGAQNVMTFGPFLT